MTHAFTQVDVFTTTPLHGNPLAVVHAGWHRHLVGGHSVVCFHGRLKF